MTKPHYETEIVLTQLQQQEQLPKYIHTDCINLLSTVTAPEQTVWQSLKFLTNERKTTHHCHIRLELEVHKTHLQQPTPRKSRNNVAPSLPCQLPVKTHS